MPKFFRPALLFVTFATCGAALHAEDVEGEGTAKAAEAAEAEASEAVDIPVGTKAFDADTVGELFQEYQAENKRRAEEMAPHMNSENLEVIELAPVNVDPYEIRNMDLLLQKLDPQPRRRLQRLAELDPKAAADLQVSMRSEERFFAGELDPGDADAGRTANVDFRKVGESMATAIEKAKAALRENKATDNQAELPTGD